MVDSNLKYRQILSAMEDVRLRDAKVLHLINSVTVKTQ